MSSKLDLLLIATIICSCSCASRSIQPRGYYTIVASGTIRSNSLYHVSISLSAYHQSCVFNISIHLEQIGLGKILESVEVEPETTKLVSMQMPELYHGQGVLDILGISGIISRDVGRLNIEERHYTVYIQTDKAKYRPGETVQFRLICIDRLTRPARVNDALVVLIHDGQRNLIKKLGSVRLLQGVFRGDLPLSEYPVLGEWKIEVQGNGLTLQEKSFQVARYALPTFTVKTISKEDVALDEGQLELTVKASHISGQPVKGNLTVLLRTAYSAFGEKLVIRKETPIDGEITVSFDFKTELNMDRNSSGRRPVKLYAFIIEVKVQDDLTRQFSQAKTEIDVHSHPYKFRIEAPKSFDGEKLVNISVYVTDLQNNPVNDTVNPVKVTAEVSKDWGAHNLPLPESKKTHLDVNGVADVSFKLSNEGFTKYRIKAEYLGWLSHAEDIEQYKGNTFSLDILTKRPEAGKELAIELKSTDTIEYFTYQFVARGDIIQSKRISVPKGDKRYVLRLNATYSMIPKTTLFVHRVKNGVFTSRLKEIPIKQTFQNSIKIQADNEVRPGAPASINITTDEGSYVGLMGIDKRLLFEATTINKADLTEDHIFTELRNYDSINMDLKKHPGIEAGLLTFSNAYSKDGVAVGKLFDIILSGDAYPKPRQYDKPRVELPRIRKLFAESWLFKDFDRVPLDGLMLHDTIPDAITSWAITGFSLNPSTGLALTKQVTTVKVFQSVFISMELPNSVKEGEIIEIPVYVFNFETDVLSVEVTLEKSSQDLELMNNFDMEAMNLLNQTISTLIPSQGNAKVVFLVRPRKPGRYDVTITALSPEASDAVRKTLLVESEGNPHSVLKTYLIHFAEDGEQKDEISIEIPKNVVRGSENVQLSVVGDIFGPLMRSLHNLVRVSHGNGEENVRYFVSNLLVLKYLKAFNHLNPSLVSKTKLYLELGYQTQLAFKHLDGSFSLMDRTVGRTGDIWLTSFVMWALQQAKHHIQVDPHVIERGLNYLKSKQREDGGFSSGSGIEDDGALTAFILLAFLVDDVPQQNHQNVITNGLNYLIEHLDDFQQATPALMTIYALVLGKHEKSEEILTKLSRHPSLTGKNRERSYSGKPIMWTKSETLQSSLEMTANSFMNLLESQQKPAQNLVPIVKALISNGLAERTPNHMIALEAMIKFARDMNFGDKNLNIHYSDDQGRSGDLHVDSENTQILQTITLNETSRKVLLQSNGNGFAFVSVIYRYNMLEENQLSSNYHTNFTVKESTQAYMDLEACVAIRSPCYQNCLTTMEIRLPSGYAVDENTLEDIQKSNEQVGSFQVNDNKSSVVVYIENVARNGTCIQLGAFKVYNVFNAKPVSIAAYDF